MGTVVVNNLQINTTLTIGPQQRAFPKNTTTRKINTFVGETNVVRVFYHRANADEVLGCSIRWFY